MKLRILPILLVMITSYTLTGQDIHFTQFTMQPMTLNPAHTGAFLGSLRVGGIYRSQWASVIDNEFSTPSAYVDVPLIKGFRNRDWIGVGVSFFQDKAGSLGLKTTGYHFSLHTTWA